MKREQKLPVAASPASLSHGKNHVNGRGSSNNTRPSAVDHGVVKWAPSFSGRLKNTVRDEREEHSGRQLPQRLTPPISYI